MPRSRSGSRRRALRLASLVVLAAALTGALAGCSFQKIAADIAGDAVSGDGEAYASDNDPELVKEAMPFGLKTYESLLEVTPRHRGLLLAAARGFTAYAFMLQWEADDVEPRDLARARKLKDRARKLYLRGRDYGFRGLETRHKGFRRRLRADPSAALAKTTNKDTAFLYWTGAAWAGALSASKDDLDLLADLPMAGAMVARVLALDEGFDQGAAHEFFISYEGGRPGGDKAKARRHYARALELSGGARATVHLALAESVALPAQDVAEFRRLLALVAKIDPDAHPHYRLVNTMARDRARRLKTRIPDLFLVAGRAEDGK